MHDECTSHVNDMGSIETILKPHKEGLPAVVLHCGMHCYRTEGWMKKATPWMQLTGLVSTGHGPQQPIAVKYLDKAHPIVAPLSDWTTVNEELYNNAIGRLEPTAHALARGKQGRAEFIVVWTNTYNEKTKVFSTTLGHNTATVANPRYLDLVTRGLLWAVGKLDEAHLRDVSNLVPEDLSKGKPATASSTRTATIVPAPPSTAIPKRGGAPTGQPARNGGRSTSGSPRI